MEHAREKLGYDFYVEESTPVSLMHANYVIENQLHEEEVKKLTMKNAEITMDLTSKIFEINDLMTKLEAGQQELNQMAMELSEKELKIERFRKKGIPQGNRSFECLHARLKFPHFSCLTLQPLFKACPKLEVIIAEKAKKGFYQKIIDLQKFLLDYHLRPRHRGLTIMQEYFYYNEQLAGFLKAQIVMSRCILSRE